MNNKNIKKPSPSIDQWLKEAKADPQALQEGMYLVHNGTVRETPKARYVKELMMAPGLREWSFLMMQKRLIR